MSIQAIDNKHFIANLFVKKVSCLTFFITFLILPICVSANTEANVDHEKGKFNAGELIMHHISDAHEIHFLTLNEGKENEKDISIYLPVILWADNGFKIFSSGHFYHHKIKDEHHGGVIFSHDGFVMAHEHIYYANENGGLNYDAEGNITNDAPLDLSITKTVAGLFITGIICILIFIGVARRYKKGAPSKPTGVQSLMEPLILFVKNEIAIPSIGHKKADAFLPFLLTVFFFIWIANLMGLIPFLGGFNVMGTLGVTIVLATVVFILTTVNGKAHYWTHIFWPPGVPLAIKFILVPIEIISIFMKPLVLMIRLTANITAGHIIILAFTSLVFIFGQQGAAMGYGVGVGSVLFMVFMYFIELLVVFLQAYVFTLLAAMYFGSALEEPHH